MPTRNDKPATKHRTPRSSVFSEMAEVVGEIREEAKKKGIDKMSKGDINRAVATARRDMKKNIAPAKRPKNKTKNFTLREINAIIAEVRRKNKKAITVAVPKDLLSQIDAQVPNRRYRESFIIAAIRQALVASPAPKTKQ